MNDSLREELASVAASLRAYLEVQMDTGAWGIPRGARVPRGQAASSAAASAAAAPPAEAPPVEAVAVAAPRPNPSPPPAADPPALAAPGPVAPAVPAAVVPAVTPPPAAPPATPAAQATVRLPVLAAEVAACVKCELSQTRKQTVFARGNPSASLCFIGEAPGADEDEQGLPFVGRAGQLLDRMIGAMGLSPEKDVYICNIIKCRPPGNRRPTPEETDACIPYLHEQIALVKPKVIVALGNTAVGTLLDTKLGITKLRGEWKLYRGTTLVMPTFHPSYLLRPSPQQADAKRQAWDDLRAVMRELKLPMPAKKGDGE